MSFRYRIEVESIERACNNAPKEFGGPDTARHFERLLSDVGRAVVLADRDDPESVESLRQWVSPELYAQEAQGLIDDEYYGSPDDDDQHQRMQDEAVFAGVEEDVGDEYLDWENDPPDDNQVMDSYPDEARDDLP